MSGETSGRRRIRERRGKSSLSCCAVSQRTGLTCAFLLTSRELYSSRGKENGSKSRRRRRCLENKRGVSTKESILSCPKTSADDDDDDRIGRGPYSTARWQRRERRGRFFASWNRLVSIGESPRKSESVRCAFPSPLSPHPPSRSRFAEKSQHGTQAVYSSPVPLPTRSLGNVTPPETLRVSKT